MHTEDVLFENEKVVNFSFIYQIKIMLKCCFFLFCRQCLLNFNILTKNLLILYIILLHVSFDFIRKPIKKNQKSINKLLTKLDN